MNTYARSPERSRTRAVPARESARGTTAEGDRPMPALQRALDTSSAVAAQARLRAALDRSPRVALQARRAGALAGRVQRPRSTKSDASVVQRMVLNLQAGDEGITKDAANIAKTEGGNVETDVAAVSGMQDGETLHVVAHLEAATIAGRSPEELAALLAPKMAGKSGISVDLHGCFTANPRAMNKKQEGGLEDLWKSYAGRFQKELSAQLQTKVPVVASLGAEYTSSSGVTRVRDPRQSQVSFNEAVERGARRLGGMSPQPKHYEQVTNAIIEDPGGGVFLGAHEGRLIFKDAEQDEIDLATGQDFSEVEEDGPFDPQAYELVE